MTVSNLFNSLPHNKILDQSNLRDFAEDKINVSYKMNLVMGRLLQNSVGKEKMLFSKCFFARVVKSWDCAVKSSNGRMFFRWVENTVCKGEITCCKQFLLFLQCFQKRLVLQTRFNDSEEESIIKQLLLWENEEMLMDNQQFLHFR